ncbi:MAG: metallophosphoesterase, partial [Blastocatellia bacterium]
MRKEMDHVEEEYVYVADVTNESVLISWGKFFFNSKWKLVHDKDLHLFEGHHGRHSSIGERCDSYGTATVRVFDDKGKEHQPSTTTDKSYAWIKGLDADREYTYRIVVPDGTGTRDWGSDPWYRYDKEHKELLPTTRTYDCRFRTFPAPDADESLTFAVIGDTGTGAEVQQDVAEALERLVEERGVRFVLLLGDIIYNKSSGGSGDDDFEWLTTYFQPYRHVISRVPVFPCMGNHDTSENWLHGVFLGEKQGDRLGVYDNLLITPRFVNANANLSLPPALPADRQASIVP